jgi:hypothetical protein
MLRGSCMSARAPAGRSLAGGVAGQRSAAQQSSPATALYQHVHRAGVPDTSLAVLQGMPASACTWLLSAPCSDQAGLASCVAAVVHACHAQGSRTNQVLCRLRLNALYCRAGGAAGRQGCLEGSQECYGQLERHHLPVWRRLLVHLLAQVGFFLFGTRHCCSPLGNPTPSGCPGGCSALRTSRLPHSPLVQSSIASQTVLQTSLATIMQLSCLPAA